MELDPAVMSAAAGYKLLIGCVVPRPIAWVSTVSADGVRNLAPFSFFMGAAGRPPTVVMSIAQRESAPRGPDGARPPKDTLANVLATGEFVVNTVNEAVGERMNATSAEVPPDVDEFALVGLTAAPSVRVRAPRVAEAPINMECRLDKTVPVGDDGHTLVIGHVVYFHVRDDLYDAKTGRVIQELLHPIARMAGQKYTRARDIFEMKRPDTNYVG